MVMERLNPDYLNNPLLEVHEDKTHFPDLNLTDKLGKCGYIPLFVNQAFHTHAEDPTDEIMEIYGFGGHWMDQDEDEAVFSEDGTMFYPDDDPQPPLVAFSLHPKAKEINKIPDTLVDKVFIYEFGFIMIRYKDGTTKRTRMD